VHDVLSSVVGHPIDTLRGHAAGMKHDQQHLAASSRRRRASIHSDRGRVVNRCEASWKHELLAATIRIASGSHVDGERHRPPRRRHRMQVAGLLQAHQHLDLCAALVEALHRLADDGAR
jgi:hypothetical protein